MRALLVLALLIVTAPAASPATPPAKHPYMGWSSWSSLRGDPTEAKIKEQADALIAAHLPALGYRYINIDDGWSNGFNAWGVPAPDLQRFPSGMDGMAQYMHQRGLLFGLYLQPGISKKLYDANPPIQGTAFHIHDIADITQAGNTHGGYYRIDFSRPAAAAYIRSIVGTLNMWKIDFIKFDFVGPGGGNTPADNREELRQWHIAITHGSRPIWLELSNYLSIDQASFWRANANGWRLENDIECYACDRSTDPAVHNNLTVWAKVADRFTDVVRWIPYAGPGGWNDLDSLELGNGDHDGITPAERQTMFTLWAISCAPLYLGSDLTRLDAADVALLSNRELIAIDQAGVPARPLDIQHLRNKGQQAWFTSYPDGSAVLALFNLDKQAATVKLSWHEVDALRGTHFAATPPATLHELLTDKEMPMQPEGVNVSLDPHATAVYRIPASRRIAASRRIPPSGQR